jgi:hypothetical protein
MIMKNQILLFLIVFILSFLVVGCPMGVGTPGGMPGIMEDMGRINSTKSFSVVYRINYDKEAFPYITIYYNVPYSGLTFLKGDSLYKASFTLNFNINHQGETIVNKSMPETLKMIDYSKTVSEEESFFGTFKESISTGNNQILLMLMDNNSDRRYLWKRTILVPEVSDTTR